MAAEGAGAGDMSDDKFDEMFAGLKRWSEKERTEYCEGLGEHPLFLDHSPSQKETDGSAYLSALQNLEYDEHDTPVSLATEAKEKGNASFAKGSAFYGHAIKHYNDCIDHASKGLKREADSKKDRDEAAVLLSTAYSNLAAIYLARRKFITALDCCEKSLQHQPRNVKALYRAAKACLEVGRADAAVAFCSSGIAAAKAAAAAAAPAADAAAAGAGAAAAAAAEPKEVAGFRELEKAAAAAVARQAAVRRDVERSRRAQLAEISAARSAIRERGIAVGPPLYRRLAMHIAGPSISPLPKPDPEQPSCLMWPVLILYPEHHTADFVTACAEVASVGDLLASVLPVSPPGPHSRPPDRLPWDSNGSYWVGGVDCFYLARAGAVLPEGRAWGDIEDEVSAALAAAERREKERAAGAAGAGADEAAKGGAGAGSAAADGDAFEELYSGSLARGSAAAGSPAAIGGPSELVRIPHAAPLLLALVQRGHVLCDVPVLYVLPRDSKNAARNVFAGRQGGSFKSVALPPELAAAVAAGAGGAV